MAKSEPKLYAVCLGDSIALWGIVYTKNEIAPDPTWQMIDKAKEAKEGVVLLSDGSPFYQIVDEKTATALDADKNSPCHFTKKTRLSHFGTPDLMNPGAGKHPNASIYTDAGAAEVGIKTGTPVHPRQAQAKADAKAKAEREKAAEKAENEKKAQAEKAAKAAKKKTGKGRK